MFSQEAVADFLRKGKYPNITSLLKLVFSRVNQLSPQQNAGLLFACLIFNGACWEDAVLAIDMMDHDKRGASLELFQSFVARTHGCVASKWVFDNWQNVEQWHFELMHQLKTRPLID